MALVTVPFSAGTMHDGATVVSATIVVDDSDLDPEGSPVFDAKLEGPFTVTVTGPGYAVIDLYRGATDRSSGRDPWRTSELLFPDGITEADSPFEIRTGGPVKFLNAVFAYVKVSGQ